MRTILNELLLDYVNTLEIEYTGTRCAKIRFLGRCKLRWLEEKLSKKMIFCYSHSISRKKYFCRWISDFNCNGIETTCTLHLLPESEPFY